jgi:hypothetical protein
MSPEKPRIAGELRLRVTSSDDPASFESGSDLLRTNGLPWSRPLYILSKHYPPLYEKLREEQFIPDDLDRVLVTLPERRIQYSRHNVLYTLNDTFIINFVSNNSSRFLVITEQGVESLRINRLFFDGRGMFRGTPYTGADTNYHLSIVLYWLFVGNALARFERSTLPDHKGARIVVLRFLKIITPVKCVIPLYDHHIRFPKEGELFQKVSSRDQVWSVDIDLFRYRNKHILRGLQLLWDA